MTKSPQRLAAANAETLEVFLENIYFPPPLHGSFTVANTTPLLTGSRRHDFETVRNKLHEIAQRLPKRMEFFRSENQCPWSA
jgi:hypothetical protein